MKEQRPSGYQTMLFLGIGLLMVWLSYIQIKPVWNDLMESFIHADYTWVFFSILISFLSHALRAYRWNDLLIPIGYRISFRNSIMYVLIAYFINYGIPRMGEISRCTLSYKYDRIPFEKSFGTVVLERTVDSMIFVLFFLIALLVDAPTYGDLSRKYIFSKISSATFTTEKFLVLFFLTGLVFFTVYYFRKKIFSFAGERVMRIWTGFKEGVMSVLKLERPLRFFLLGIAIWICYYYSLMLCFYAFKGTAGLGHKEALVLLLIGTLAVVVSPGGLGAYPLMLSGILTGLYGVDKVSAFSMSWMVWGSQFVLIVFSGLFSLILLPIIHRNT